MTWNYLDMNSKIWVYWNSGWEHVPSTVKFCARSWKRYANDYEIIYLSNDNIHNYVDINKFPKNIHKAPIQAFSDYLRICLVEQHGGIWLDSTVFLTKHINDWLPNYLNNWNMFLFSNVRPDRKIASWFIAAEKEHEAMQCWKRKCYTYWIQHTSPHNYFWFHHLFHDVIKEQDFDDKWNSVIKHDAKAPRWYKNEAMYANNPAYFSYYKDHKIKLNKTDIVIKEAIENKKQAPVYKFDKGFNTNTKMFRMLENMLL